MWGASIAIFGPKRHLDVLKPTRFWSVFRHSPPGTRRRFSRFFCPRRKIFLARHFSSFSPRLPRADLAQKRPESRAPHELPRTNFSTANFSRTFFFPRTNFGSKKCSKNFIYFSNQIFQYFFHISKNFSPAALGRNTRT